MLASLTAYGRDIESSSVASGYGNSAFKRLFDVVVSLALIAFLSPLLMMIAVLVALDSAGGVFFEQARHGRSGRRFMIVKFRSMKAENHKKFRQATHGDPRVTRVGRFLRKSSLDELPQLLNVLRGDMSIVGPRPHAIEHDEEFARQISNYMCRYHTKPGITGLAQVHGARGATPTLQHMQLRVDLDLKYVENSSFLLDCKILMMTFREVVFPRNAF